MAAVSLLLVQGGRRLHSHPWSLSWEVRGQGIPGCGLVCGQGQGSPCALARPNCDRIRGQAASLLG